MLPAFCAPQPLLIPFQPSSWSNDVSFTPSIPIWMALIYCLSSPPLGIVSAAPGCSYTALLLSCLSCLCALPAASANGDEDTHHHHSLSTPATTTAVTTVMTTATPPVRLLSLSPSRPCLACHHSVRRYPAPGHLRCLFSPCILWPSHSHTVLCFPFLAPLLQLPAPPSSFSLSVSTPLIGTLRISYHSLRHLLLRPESLISFRSVLPLPHWFHSFPRGFSSPSSPASGWLSLPDFRTFCSHFPAFFSVSRRSSLTYNPSTNMAMQDRYGLFTNPRSPKMLVTTSDFDYLFIAFRLWLRDGDRWVVVRSSTLHLPGLPAPSHSATLYTSPVLSWPASILAFSPN